MGKLIPVSCVETLPGDTFQGHTSALIRVSPMVAPVMHPVQVRFHSWFVPTRILWPGWEDFITAGPDGNDTSLPPFATDVTVEEKSPMDYMGVPPGVRTFSTLPAMAYAKIFNENYRDQDLATEINETTVTGALATDLQNIAWGRDYFTQARPFLQKGPDVTVPIGENAPIHMDIPSNTTFSVNNINGNPIQMATLGPDTFTGTVGHKDTAGTPETLLYADLKNATGANVNDIRRAFALQRYAEARAQYGSRLSEYLRYLGVASSDARLQRPEYLGGGKSTISFSEVLNTASDPAGTTLDPLGRMGGHGISAMKSRKWRRFFEEHGYVITCMSVRPKNIYTEAQHRSFNRTTREDYWQKELQSIGQQEIYAREINANQADPNQIFGYGDRYAEYKSHPSRVSSEFRDTLNYWHLARSFGSDVALNEDFIKCNPSKRIHAEQTNDSLWCMVNNSLKARRLVRASNDHRII